MFDDRDIAKPGTALPVHPDPRCCSSRDRLHVTVVPRSLVDKFLQPPLISFANFGPYSRCETIPVEVVFTKLLPAASTLAGLADNHVVHAHENAALNCVVDKKAGGSYLVGGTGGLPTQHEGSFFPSVDVSKYDDCAEWSGIIPFRRTSGSSGDAAAALEACALLLGIAARALGHYAPHVTEGLAQECRNHAVVGSTFMWPTHAMQTSRITPGLHFPANSAHSFPANSVHASIASHQLAVRRTSATQIANTPLLVFEHKDGGRAVEIKVHEPGYMCIVVMHPDQCLHSNVLSTSTKWCM